MRTLTQRQHGVYRLLRLYETAYTVAEIASALNAPASGVRSALEALERYGLVEVKGSALTGGRTWGALR